MKQAVTQRGTALSWSQHCAAWAPDWCHHWRDAGLRQGKAKFSQNGERLGLLLWWQSGVAIPSFLKRSQPQYLLLLLPCFTSHTKAAFPECWLKHQEQRHLLPDLSSCQWYLCQEPALSSWPLGPAFAKLQLTLHPLWGYCNFLISSLSGWPAPLPHRIPSVAQTFHFSLKKFPLRLFSISFLFP